jgi:glycosyltransferase involved in cell wall biosynthesis
MNIGISFGAIESWNDGLGEFSRQLGQRYAQSAKHLRSALGVQLHFHMPAKWHGLFGEEVQYMDVLPSHRKWYLSRTRFALWHTLHQHNRYRPPLFTPQRVLTIHDLNFLYGAGHGGHGKLLRKTQRLVDRYNHVVGISNHVAEDLSRHLRIGGPVRTVYNGCSDFTRLEAHAPDRPPAGDFYFHLSRMARSKNVNALLELAAELPNETFVFAGPASTDSQIVRHIVQLRDLRNVLVYESVDDAQKAWFYRNCKAFLFPSLTEGFGLPPLEAMHFGKPVFLSRRTSLPEVGGEAGYYFDDFAPAAMARVLREGMAHFEYHDGPARARTRAAQFNWNDCATGYLRFFTSLIGEPVSGHGQVATV